MIYSNDELAIRKLRQFVVSEQVDTHTLRSEFGCPWYPRVCLVGDVERKLVRLLIVPILQIIRVALSCLVSVAQL